MQYRSFERLGLPQRVEGGPRFTTDHILRMVMVDGREGCLDVPSREFRDKLLPLGIARSAASRGVSHSGTASSSSPSGRWASFHHGQKPNIGYMIVMRRGGGLRDAPPREFHGKEILLYITHTDSLARVHTCVEAALIVKNRPLLRLRHASGNTALDQGNQSPSTSGATKLPSSR